MGKKSSFKTAIIKGAAGGTNAVAEAKTRVGEASMGSKHNATEMHWNVLGIQHSDLSCAANKSKNTDTLAHTHLIQRLSRLAFMARPMLQITLSTCLNVAPQDAVRR